MALTKVSYSMINGAVFNVLDYEADSTGVTDSWQAIQNAINAASPTNLGGVNAGTVYFPRGSYLISKPLNLTSDNGAINRRGIRLLGENAGSGDYQYGTKIVGATNGYAMVEIIDNDNLQIENLTFINAASTPSTVGIYQARRTGGTSPSGWCGNCYFKNVTIQFSNDGTTQNNKFGTIGIINVAGEETTYDRCEVWSNCPLVLTWSNSFRKSVSALTATTYDTFAYNPYWATQADITSGASNTVFRTIACRFIATGYNAPVVLLNEVGSVYMYGNFLQKRTSNTGTDSTNGTAYECWNVNQIVIDSATENVKTPILLHRSFNAANINLRGTIGNCPGPIVGVIHFLPDAPSFVVEDTNINIQYTSGVPNGFMTYTNPYGVGVNEPAVYTLKNCEFGIQANNANATVDNKLTYKSRNVKYNFSDMYWQVDEGYLRFPLIQKNISKNTTTSFVTINLPTVISNQSACSVGVTANLQLSNAGVATNVAPSSASAVLRWQIVRDSVPTATTVLGFLDVQHITSYNTAVNQITGVGLAEYSPGTAAVQLAITTSETGSAQDDIYITGYVELIYMGGYSSSPQITLI